MEKEGGPSRRRTTLIVSYMDRVRVECIERVDHRIDDNWNEYVVVVGCGCCSSKIEHSEWDVDANEVIFHTFQTKSALGIVGIDKRREGLGIED
jgi:hypothetical protein